MAIVRWKQLLALNERRLCRRKRRPLIGGAAPAIVTDGALIGPRLLCSTELASVRTHTLTSHCAMIEGGRAVWCGKEGDDQCRSYSAKTSVGPRLPSVSSYARIARSTFATRETDFRFGRRVG